jgi:hypothetical protein
MRIMNTSNNILKILVQIHLFTFLSTYIIWEFLDSSLIIYLQWLLTAVPISIVLYIYSKSIDRFANKVLHQEQKIQELETKING